MELRNDLSSSFGLELPATLIFDYPTVAALAAFVADQLLAQQPSKGAVEARVPPVFDAAAVTLEVHQVVASVLGVELPPAQPLMEAGLDSLAAVELRNELVSHLGVELPATAVFDYPTITALSNYIVTALSSSAPAGAAAAHSDSNSFKLDTPAMQGKQLSTHLVGLSCRYPLPACCSAGGKDGFWAGALQAADPQETIPLSRWDVERLYAPSPANGRMYARFGAFVHGVDFFDAEVSTARQQGCGV